MSQVPSWAITVGIGALQVVFYLGLYVAIIRQNKKDVADLRKEVNGVGARGRQNEAVEDARYLAIALSTMALCKPEDRQWLAEFLFRAGPRAGRVPQ
ncbi:MAG: hypothetical protein LAO08_20245 [Acidobacteriia bacterium]|nr:hypothetical protein [Terriglobia bacterium]